MDATFHITARQRLIHSGVRLRHSLLADQAGALVAHEHLAGTSGDFENQY